jgi:hypothetical protein
VDREDIGGGHCDAAICAPVTGSAGKMRSSRRCARSASISRSALIRTSAAVARSTTSSLVNASAPRVLSRRANSCTLIICSHILGLLLTQRNRRFDRLLLRPPRTVGESHCARFRRPAPPLKGLTRSQVPRGDGVESRLGVAERRPGAASRPCPSCVSPGGSSPHAVRRHPATQYGPRGPGGSHHRDVGQPRLLHYVH